MVPALLSVSVSSVATTSVAEPLLFWAASAPEVRGPGAGSDQIGSAPVPGKKRRLQAAPSPYAKISHFVF